MVGVRAKDHDDKRQLILERSAALFAKQGFHKTSISEISAACEATKSWVYHYFPSKEQILFSILVDFFEVVRDRTGRAVEKQAEADQRFRAFLREILSILQEYKINYAALFNELDVLAEADRREIQSLERRFVVDLRELLQALNPNLSDMKIATPVTMLVFGAINWTHTWYNARGALALEDLVDVSAKLIVNGVVSL